MSVEATVCLVTPPSGFLLDERVFITLGILRVAACLERAGYFVEHLDLSGVENYVDAVKDLCRRTNAAVFALTATSPQMPAVTDIVTVLRRERPDARLILGGPHVTLIHAALRSERKRGIEGRSTLAYFQLLEMFDVLVVGDGEYAIFEALKLDAPKLIDADDPRGPLFLTNKTYEQLPMPARHLVDVNSYRYSIDGVWALSVLAQIGCPFNCSFCGGRESAMLRRVRNRSTANVINEIIHLYDTYGSKGIMFYDDELNVNKEVVGLMNAIADLQLGLRLRGFVKAELFTDEQAEAMHRAGFRWLLVGFESGSERVLKNINKKATRSDNTNCIRIAHKHGLKVKALMSLGHAGESKDTVVETKDWLLAERPDDFDVTVITTYPGTPYFDRAEQTQADIWTFTAPQTGDRLHSYGVDWNREASYYKGVPGNYNSFVFTDHLTADDLTGLRDELEASVRKTLGIPFNAAAPGIRYEASMGQLPGYILRKTGVTV